MKNYLFSLEAVSLMLSECYRTGNSNETGGILIGPKKHKGIVTDIVPSSSFAERNTTTYYQSKKDVEILNQKLKQYQKLDYDFLGYFHRHPSGMYRLSQGDIATSKDILQSPNYAINNDLLMCIVTECHGQNGLPIFTYALNLNTNHNVVVQNSAIKVMPKDCIKKYMEYISTITKIKKTGGRDESNHIRQDSETTSGIEAS